LVSVSKTAGDPPLMHFRAQASLPFIAGFVEQASSMTYPVNSAPAAAASEKTNESANGAMALLMVGLLDVIAQVIVSQARRRSLGKPAILLKVSRNSR
jgi:hypothetical protein